MKFLALSFILVAQLFGQTVFAEDSVGYKILSIEKESSIEKLGLKQGDVITSINGQAVVTPKDMEKVADLMKKSDKVEVELIRGGVTKKIIYNLK